MINSQASRRSRSHQQSQQRRRGQRAGPFGQGKRREFRNDGGLPFVVMLTEADDSMGCRFSGAPPERVYVEDLKEDGWASTQGITNGDELMLVDRHAVTDMIGAHDLDDRIRKRPVLLTFRHSSATGIDLSTVMQVGASAVVPLAASGGVHDSMASHIGHDEALPGMPFVATATESDKKLGFKPKGMPPNRSFVKEVEEGGWAERQGVKVGDEFIGIGGRRMEEISAKELMSLMEKRPLMLTFVSACIAVSQHPPKQDDFFSAIVSQADKSFGFTPQIIVGKVEPGGWADHQGLLPGDQLMSVFGQAVAALFDGEIERLWKSRPCLLTFLRNFGNAGKRFADTASQTDAWGGFGEEVARDETDGAIAALAESKTLENESQTIIRGHLDAQVESDEDQDIASFEERDPDLPIPPGDDASGDEAWPQLHNITLTGKNFGPVKAANCREVWLRHARHGAYTAMMSLDEACEIEYVGPAHVDVSLRIFKGEHPGELSSFNFIGYVHVIENPAKRKVVVDAGENHYFLGIEVLFGLNQNVLQKATNRVDARKEIRAHSNLANDIGCETRAENADFLAIFGSKDEASNNASILHLRDVGVRRGPWTEHRKKVVVCTDRSLGMGRHFADDVVLRLGSRGFGKGRELGSFFEELRQAALSTKYGVLILSPSDRYLRSRAIRAELALIPGYKQYVYDFAEDRILLREEYIRYSIGSTHSGIIDAVEAGDLEKVQSILDHDILAAICDTTASGDTALHIAALRGKKRLIQMLLAAGADPNAENSFAHTPLHASVIGGHDLAAALLVANRSDLNRQDRQGCTPLHLAASRGFEMVMSRLLDAKPDLNLLDLDGSNALGNAVEFGHLGAALLLREAGEDPDLAEVRRREARWDIEAENKVKQARTKHRSNRSKEEREKSAVAQKDELPESDRSMMRF